MKERPAESVENVLRRNLICVSGKGGVGKTAVSQAIALALASGSKSKRVLWVAFEDPLRPPAELEKAGPNLWHLNCEANAAFEEYAAMKIGGSTMTRLFLSNKLVRYLAKATPGMHELVLLGKLWNERLNYDHVVADMPSTGYGLAMFQSTENFARLFKGGPIHRDAEAMLDTLRDPKRTGQLIVSLPEEMPLRESLELGDFLSRIFPSNAPAYVANRLFPDLTAEAKREGLDDPDSWPTPVPSSARDYAVKRGALEAYNLRLWREDRIPFGGLSFVPPPPRDATAAIVGHLAEELRKKGYVA